MIKKISNTNIDLAAKQLWDVLHSKIQYLPKQDQKTVELAFTQMVMAHGESRQKSGTYHIVHPIVACLILTEIGLFKDTLSACLLHDVPERTNTDLKDLAKDFSSEIIYLIGGVAKFSVVKYKGEERYAENLRRMFVAMSRDIRVIFIKLADRIHNLETLKYVDEEKRYRIALESLHIYAPIAERLGMSKFRGMIEDLAFPFVHPEEYKQLVQTSKLEINRRNKITQKIIKKTKRILREEDLPFEDIFGRAKKYYSIYKKIQEKNKSLDKIYDLIALRVVTYNLDQCYQILSIIHSHFEPIDGRVKDYIAHPKPNGYQSIHTTVGDKETGEIFEFQIRTVEMNNYAEFGIATHWAYKEGVDMNKENEELKPDRFKWISELVDIGKREMSEEEYLKKVKLNLYQDRIFVMTPKKDVIDLRIGATALDFAFKIHEQVGQKAIMAKINGEPAKLGDKLENGDTIEIITSKNQTPRYDWLERVKTSNAAKKIRRFLKKDKKT